MDKNAILSLLDNKENEYLAHYGIKGQEWGRRRFQNEDGSLTPEGRRRYGLKPDYSNMSDKELQEAITKKRTQNQYVDLMTAGTKKKQQELSGLISAISSTSKSVNAVLDKTVYDSQRKGFQTEINSLTEKNEKLKQDIKAAKSAGDNTKRNNLQEQKEENEELIKEYKNDIKGIDSAKKSIDTIAGLPGEHSDKIAKFATKSELSEKTAEAYRNINEMDSDQLKKTVDRMLLEKQYDEIVNPPKPSRVERGREIFQTIGVGLSLVVSALTIAQLLKGLKEGKAVQSDDSSDFLAHYGVKGMRKGERRYQNEDGSLTPEGYRHYGIDPNGKRDSIPDTRAVLNRQKAESKMKNQELRLRAKQRAYTQKIAQRQALREARNRAQIQSVYDRQVLDIRRRAQEQENKAKAENRANIRKNIIKGVASIAVIGAALYVGRHFIREAELNKAHIRDIEKINLEHSNKISEIKANADAVKINNVDLLKEKNRMTEAKWKRKDAKRAEKLASKNKENDTIQKAKEKVTKESKTETPKRPKTPKTDKSKNNKQGPNAKEAQATKIAGLLSTPVKNKNGTIYGQQDPKKWSVNSKPVYEMAFNGREWVYKNLRGK